MTRQGCDDGGAQITPDLNFDHQEKIGKLALPHHELQYTLTISFHTQYTLHKYTVPAQKLTMLPPTFLSSNPTRPTTLIKISASILLNCTGKRSYNIRTNNNNINNIINDNINNERVKS